MSTELDREFRYRTVVRKVTPDHWLGYILIDGEKIFCSGFRKTESACKGTLTRWSRGRYGRRLIEAELAKA